MYGFIRSPVDDRGNSWRNTSRSSSVGTSFSIPTIVIEGPGQRRAEPPVSLGLDDAHRARLGDGEVRPADRNRRVEELLAQVRTRRGSEDTGLVGELRLTELAPEEIPYLEPILVDRRNEDVRRRVPGKLADQLREIGLDGRDPDGGKRIVDSDLVGRQRLHLHHLAGSGPEDERRHDLVGIVCVARPVDDAACRVTADSNWSR